MKEKHTEHPCSSSETKNIRSG